jgi:hypothetical protein
MNDFDDGFEADMFDMCENCWIFGYETEVNFDHWSGRNLCLDCEPHPMMDDGTRR